MTKIGLHWWIVLGIVAGAILGTALNRAYLGEAEREVVGAGATTADLQAHADQINQALERRVEATAVGAALDGVRRIFLNLLKLIVIPLVFFSLVSGIAGMGEASRLGRVGLKTAVWYISTSLLAILTGLAFVNLIGPGFRAAIAIPTAPIEAHAPGSFWDVLVGLVPDNVVAAASRFDMFGIIFFSLLFGIFLLQVEERERAGMVAFIDGGMHVMMRMTRGIIATAPVGIAALVGYAVAVSGPKIFLSLIAYVATVASALATHFLITLPLLFWLVTRRSPYLYMKAMSPALLTAFSTASSSGTLAVTLERAEDGAGISNRITSFVLPLGATVNMDGTALYECVTVLFIAQLHAATHAGVDPLTFGQQVLVVFLALLVSIGAAGIPHAGLVMMVIILKAVDLPLEYTALIWAVDRVLDMARTATNVWSDAAGAAVVAHTEGEIDESVLFARGG